jgi:DNA-binding NarL/FixJ family response regulator
MHTNTYNDVWLRTLSPRENQILQLIVTGHSDKEIAGKLGIAFNTARTHHQNILYKTGKHSVKELIYHAVHEKRSQAGVTPSLL